MECRIYIYKENTEVEVLPVMDLLKESAKHFFLREVQQVCRTHDYYYLGSSMETGEFAFCVQSCIMSMRASPLGARRWRE